MSSTKINLGKVALTPKGEWNAATTYERLDVVSYQGSSYTVLKECTGQTPSEGEYYSLLASKGAKGEKGDPALSEHNPNMLRNFDFRRSVNTRGRETYEATSSMAGTIDLWVASGTKVSVMDDYLRLTSIDGVSKWSRFLQMSNIKFSPSITYTLSILVKVNSLTGMTVLRFCDKDYNSLVNISGTTIGVVPLNITSGYELFSVTITPDGPALSDIFGVEILSVGTNEEGSLGSFDINVKAIKLEVGSYQTLAHKVNDMWVLNDPLDYEHQYSVSSQYDLMGNHTGYIHSNVNMLDNPDFRINSRGKTGYNELSQYTVDRWLLTRWNIYDTQSVTIFDDGISLAVGSGLIQKLDTNVIGDLHGKHVTISALIGDEIYSLTTTWDKTSLWVSEKMENGYQLAWNGQIPQIQVLNVDGSPNNFVKIMKMELGFRQTLAHKEDGVWVLNDPLPNMVTELAKCQRYFVYNSHFYSIAHTYGKSAWFSIPLPGPMRISPVIGNLYLTTIDETNNTSAIRTDDVEDIIAVGTNGNYPNEVYVRVTFKEWTPENKWIIISGACSLNSEL